jgi:hypothetical protein
MQTDIILGIFNLIAGWVLFNFERFILAIKWVIEAPGLIVESIIFIFAKVIKMFSQAIAPDVEPSAAAVTDAMINQSR